MKKLLRSSTIKHVFWLCIILLIWHLLSLFSGLSPQLLPPISAVLEAFIWEITRGRLLNQIGFSLLMISIGLIIACVLALLFAMLSLVSRVFKSLVDTLLLLAQPLPAVAVMPLLLIWFGTGQAVIIAVIVHSVLWPMLINLNTGIEETPQIYLELAKTLSLSLPEIFFSIYIPSSAVYIISGVKIGWARAWRALISAEMIFSAIGGGGGIGWFIFESRSLMNTPRVFLGAIVVVIIGIFVDELIIKNAEKFIAKKWNLSANPTKIVEVSNE